MIYGNFKTDLMMIEDDFLSKTTIKHINDLHTAEASLILSFEQSKIMMKRSSDELFRERITELDNI